MRGPVQRVYMASECATPAQDVLALQGGGAHGAYSWGALDRLLEDGWAFGAISGVSSGAMLAAMAVQGWRHDGAPGARAHMRRLWERVAEAHVFAGMTNPFEGSWGWDQGLALGTEMAWHGLTQALRLFSPAQLNPFGQNPLKPLLEELLDLEAIRDPAAPRLYVAATDVQSGAPVIFDNASVSVDALLASACIPMMFPAVVIGGRALWDGGYSCNPALAPLLTPLPRRLVLIRAQPRRRAGVPSSTADIVHRLHEIAFQAPLEAALLGLPAGVTLLDIGAEALAAHALTSKMTTDKVFLESLFAAGREEAGRLVAA
jgi:NTE family protein